MRMKTDDVRFLGSQNVKIVQLINILVLILWTFVCLILYLFNQSLVSIAIMTVGFIILILINFIYSKFYEIAITSDFIIVSNLFRKNQFIHDSFDHIERTFLSPMVYKLVVKESKPILFTIDNDKAFRLYFDSKDNKQHITEFTELLKKSNPH